MLKEILMYALQRFGRVLPEIEDTWVQATSAKAGQILLASKYRELMDGDRIPTFDEVQFRAFSQNGEDGILLLIFSLIGTVNKICVEICAGDGIECNCANLIINHGWTGILIDGNRKLIERGRRFYGRCKDTFSYPPQLLHAWVDRENVNDLLASAGVSGPIDLLSIDMDGNDYWIMEAITCVQPRVIVAEINDVWGPDEAMTVAYDPARITSVQEKATVNFGASLAAFIKLLRPRGYRLIGTERYGFNAFFLHRGIGEAHFPEIGPGDCLQHPKVLADRRQRSGLNMSDWTAV